MSKMELLIKIVNSIKSLSFSKAGSTLDVFQSSEHASEYVSDYLEKTKDSVFNFWFLSGYSINISEQNFNQMKAVSSDTNHFRQKYEERNQPWFPQ